MLEQTKIFERKGVYDGDCTMNVSCIQLTTLNLPPDPFNLKPSRKHTHTTQSQPSKVSLEKVPRSEEEERHWEHCVSQLTSCPNATRGIRGLVVRVGCGTGDESSFSSRLRESQRDRSPWAVLSLQVSAYPSTDPRPSGPPTGPQ